MGKSGDDFQCDMCGSIYNETLIRLAEGHRDEAICDVCQQVMNEWRGNVESTSNAAPLTDG